MDLANELADVCNAFNYHPTPGRQPTATTNTTDSLQLILYGAPGTGKSWRIEQKVESCPDRVFRTTFHPDSDYSTFVGAFKPKMEDDKYDTIMQVNKIVTDADGNESVKTELKAVKKTSIAYLFVSQIFTDAYVKAWEHYASALKDNKPADPVFLVIEEINRGNCAQIFGDLFQLLDRDNGFSKYRVRPDADLRDHLKKAFDQLDFGTQYKDVQEGSVLILPNNLCIWATMNTSDQSLFPIDSAFKRRWDWEYVPIEDAGKGWKIDVGAVQYKWWSFLEKINDVIATETSSEDKQLGYFFVKAKGDVIDAKTFVSKVIFYLWGDVFKDNLPDEDAFKYTFKKDDKDEKRLIRFADFFHPEGDNTKEQWRDKLLTSFLDALEVEKDLSTSSTTGSSNAPGQGSSTTDGGVATANE